MAMSIVTSNMKFMADTGFIEGMNIKPTTITFYGWHFSSIIPAEQQQSDYAYMFNYIHTIMYA